MLRRAIWLETDKQYKSAAEALIKIKTGKEVQVETADGAVETYGDGKGPKVGVKVTDRAAERALLVDPSLALGELYMDGRVLVTHGDLYDLVALGVRNMMLEGGPRWLRWIENLRVATRSLRQRNDRRRARQRFAMTAIVSVTPAG